MTIEEAVQNMNWLKLQTGRIENEALDMAISALRGQQDTKWISVKGRLPEPEQGVILCTRETETYGRHQEKKKIYRNIYAGYFDGYE